MCYKDHSHATGTLQMDGQKAEDSKPREKRTKQRRAKRVTIMDVAEDAQVSFAAVSKVLRNAYGVSDALRARVNASIEKLGYTPNTAARGMRGGRTFVIGTIFPDFRNPFFSDLLAGIDSALKRTPYQSILGIEQHSTTPALIQSMLDMQVDGIIIVGSTASEEELSAFGQKIPMAIIGHHLPGAASFDTVNNNDRTSSMLVVEHLVDKGFRNIVMLSLESSNGTVIEEREEGYRLQMQQMGNGQNIEIVRSPQALRDVQTATKRLLESESPPEAIFCWTDFVALEVISVAETLGLSVPGDLAVVGHDNTFYCDMKQNSLTSIDQSGEQLGLQAARLLVERIEGRTAAEHRLTQPRLVVRDSSRNVAPQL